MRPNNYFSSASMRLSSAKFVEICDGRDYSLGSLIYFSVSRNHFFSKEGIFNLSSVFFSNLTRNEVNSNRMCNSAILEAIIDRLLNYFDIFVIRYSFLSIFFF